MMDTTLIWGMVLFTSFMSMIIWSHLVLSTPALQGEWIEEPPLSTFDFQPPFSSPSSLTSSPYETSGSMG